MSLLCWLMALLVAIFFPFPFTLPLFLVIITPIWLAISLQLGWDASQIKKTKWKNFAEWERDHLKNLDRETKS